MNLLTCPRCKLRCLNKNDCGESAIYRSRHLICVGCWHDEDAEIEREGTNDLPETLNQMDAVRHGTAFRETGRGFEKLNMERSMDDLMDKIRKARDIYDGLSPEERAAHDYEQRRSFVRGMCPDDKDINEWSKVVDKIMPPLLQRAGIRQDWVVAKLKKIANTGQSIEPDHWKFRCMARDTAREIIDKIEQR